MYIHAAGMCTLYLYFYSLFLLSLEIENHTLPGIITPKVFAIKTLGILYHIIVCFPSFEERFHRKKIGVLNNFFSNPKRGQLNKNLITWQV
jgi:hypothetical protein